MLVRVAGGWGPGRGESLADRVRPREPHREPDPDPTPGPSGIPDRALRPTTEGRHCWVVGPAGERLAGVLLEWRQRGTWEGRVAYAVPGVGAARLVEEWVGADRLKQADTG